MLLFKKCIRQTVLVSGCSQGWDVQMVNTRLHKYEIYRLLLVYSLRSSIWLYTRLLHIHLSVSLSRLLLSLIFIFLVMPSPSKVSSEVWAHTCLCVALHWCVSVSQSIPVFDYGSWEATGPRWPRRPQASQVSEASIPRWLLHSCENRKAAPTTNTPGAGGKTANLWLINNRSFRSPQQDLFPIFFFSRIAGLKETKHASFPVLFFPSPPCPVFFLICWCNVSKSTCFLLCSGGPVCVRSFVFILQLCVMDLFFFPPRRGVEQ